ncbi:acylphosphatase [Methanogenium sp. MK-MG]|uniref:acylphosphatase n=1 Tax=Methanogenium sp. MK-MG TaxID=2599926 RepID=UPI0013E9D834|nr:acylphosphatase [Methanogenium sp. MK-MG]KAF1078021.1 Acylphosphatase [Methanogenium sp. MK-MG]
MEKDATETAALQRTVEIIVTGRVQHVGFRACVKKMAQHLTVTGVVMNLPDGTVAIRATAEQVILEKFISLLYSCPRALVRDLEITDPELCEFDGFSIIVPE